jgi:hypothetical protein
MDDDLGQLAYQCQLEQEIKDMEYFNHEAYYHSKDFEVKERNYYLRMEIENV